MGSPKTALSPGRGSPRTPTKSPLGRNVFTSDQNPEELDLSNELCERVARMAAAEGGGTSTGASSQATSTAGTPTKPAPPFMHGGLKRTRSERVGYLLSEGLARVSEVVSDGPFPGVVVLGLAVALGVEWLRRMPIFPVFAVCYIIWGVAQKRTKEQVQKARRQWELEVTEAKAETALESVDWLNCVLQILWRHVYEPQFALQLCTVLQKKLSKSRPKFMQTLEFTHFALGTAPPVFGPAKIVRHMGDQALDIDFTYQSEHPEVVIQSRMQLGTLFYVPGSFSSTIKVTSLKISGKLRCRPFAAERVMLVSFTGEPKMHIDISLWGISMKALQPILSWLTSELKSAIAKQWVEPRRFCMELRAAALPNAPKKTIKAQGGIMKVAVLQVRLFDGPTAAAQTSAEIHLQLKVRGTKARSKMMLSRREGGATIYTPGGTPPEQEFKLPGNTGVATLVCSPAADFHSRPVLGTCSIQHKWMHDGGTCYWHNLKGGKPAAVRTFEPYTTWVPLRDVTGAEVGEACVWSSASWLYGVPEPSTVDRTMSHAAAAANGSSDRDKIVHEALASRDGFWIITLVEARNLVAKDSNGKSDPYCKLRVGHKKKLSKVKSKTLSPVWNETFSFSQGSRLVLTCMDKDFLGFDNDFLGIVDLSLIQFKDGATHDIWLPLQATDSGEVHLRIIFEKRHDTSSASGWSPLKSLRWTASPTGQPGEMHASRISIAPSGISPDLMDTPEYSPMDDSRDSEDTPGGGTPGEPTGPEVPPQPTSPGAESTWQDAEVLVVTLVEASNLIVRDFIMKKSDPFCKLKLGKLSRKSSVKSGNLNPIWNEGFEFIIAEGRLDPDEPLLRLECRDKDFFSTDFLGAAHIDLRELRPGVTEDMWMTLAGVKHGRIHVRLLLRPPLDASVAKRFEHPIQRFESRTPSQSSLRDSDQEL